jgi:hypothetical protein
MYDIARGIIPGSLKNYGGTVERLYGDAALANPEIYEVIEAEDIGYTIPLPAKWILGIS